MGSGGSIYDPVGNSLDCGDRGEIMGGNGMQRGVLTAPTRQENIQDKSMLVIFSPPLSPPCLTAPTPEPFTHFIIKTPPRILNETQKRKSKFLCKIDSSKMFLLEQFDVKWQCSNANLI